MKIDEIKDDTRDLLTQFKQIMKIVDGLRVYNKQQERLIAQQEREMSELNQSIDNVTVIERQVGPLLQRMIDSWGVCRLICKKLSIMAKDMPTVEPITK